MYAPDNIRASLRLNAPDIILTSEEQLALDTAARVYRDTHITAFWSRATLDQEMFSLLRNRILNIALTYECKGTLKEKIKIVSHKVGEMTNLIHGNMEEEMLLIEACQKDISGAFDYIFLLMSHKIVRFMYENDCQRCRFMDPEELFNEFLLELYNICKSYPADKLKKHRLAKSYFSMRMKHYYREISGKNDVINCSGSTRQRIESVAAFVKSIEDDYDGTIPLSFAEIKEHTGARDNEIHTYFALRNDGKDFSLSSLDYIDVKDDSKSFEEEVEEKLIRTHVNSEVAKNVDLTEEEIDELITALVKHVDDNVNSSRGHVSIRRLSNSSINRFCLGSSYNKEVVDRVLEEFEYLQHKEQLFFA